MVADVASEEQFGPYLVYERLGVGGMATVHRALERGMVGFERVVALKRLLPHLAEDASFIKSFVREAKLASLLGHPNVVQIFELGRVGSEYFISMEYIDGRDIRQILRHARKVTGPPPLGVVIGLLLQLCDALDYAHTKTDESGEALGLVHRDVSPSNLLVTGAGHLKVIDFGIAKAQTQQLRTQTGKVKGKLAYMAPEAITGSRDLDARSDLFSVGVIMHELLTARPLFASKNEYQTLLKVQRGDIMPPSTYNPNVPPELDAIVLKTLARDANDRYASAADLKLALLGVRKQLALATGVRDVGAWLTYAFSIEQAPGPDTTAIILPTAEEIAAEASKPVVSAKEAKEVEEAVEVAWGGGVQEEVSDVHDVDIAAIPDVSAKHLVPDSAEIRKAVGPSPLLDDIPPAEPSHGVRTRPKTTGSMAIPAGLAPPRVRTVTIPPRDNAAAESDGGRATPSPRASERVEAKGDAERPPRAATNLPARVSSATIPPPMSVASPLQRASARSMTEQRPITGTPDPSNISSDDIPIPDASATDPDLPVVSERSRRTTGRGTGVVPATKPGVVPNRAATGPVPRTRPATRPSTPMPMMPMMPAVGSGMIERQRTGRVWPVLLTLLVLAAAAAGIVFYLVKGDSSTGDGALAAAQLPTPTVQPQSKIKFDTQPIDAEITVEGHPMHAGAPWSIQLEPGVYPIRIQRAGFKAWLTSVELSPGETYSLRVVLEPLDAGSDATLVIDSSPSGLEAVLDGQLLAMATPLKLSIAPGPHTIVLRQGGVEVWKQNLIAQANASYQFTPSMTAEKQRERRARAYIADSDDTADPKPPATRPVVTGEQPLTPDQTTSPGSAAPVPPPPPTTTQPVVPAPPPPPIKVPPAPVPPTPTPAPVKPTPPPANPVAKGPVVVPPTAVKRIGGAIPTVASSKRDQMPGSVSAKVCIDTSGTITDVAMMTKLERMTALDLARGIRTWTYAPYKDNGVAVAACFVVSFKVK